MAEDIDEIMNMIETMQQTGPETLPVQRTWFLHFNPYGF